MLSEQPLGEIAVLKPEKWNGLWVTSEGKYVQLRVLDAQKGLLEGLRAAPSDPCNALPRDKPEAPEPHALRQIGSWYFPNERSAGGQLIENVVAFFRNQDALVFFLIDTGRAQALIEQGQLPGRIERRGEYEQVILGSLSAEHHRVLFPEKLTEDELNAKERLRPPVLWRPPVVIIKLPPGVDPCKKSN